MTVTSFSCYISHYVQLCVFQLNYTITFTDAVSFTCRFSMCNATCQTVNAILYNSFAVTRDCDWFISWFWRHWQQQVTGRSIASIFMVHITGIINNFGLSTETGKFLSMSFGNSFYVGRYTLFVNLYTYRFCSKCGV